VVAGVTIGLTTSSCCAGLLISSIPKGMQRLLREGGGQLSDDIPPPTADERAAAEAEKANPPAEGPLMIPGLELAPAPPSLAHAGRTTTRARPDLEGDRLRALLLHALRELEALRALLN
jgi:hypothetical protein